MGPRGAMQDHLDVCSHGKIECQLWPCREMVLRKEFVNHLKGDHEGVKEWQAGESGRVKNLNWIGYDIRKKQFANWEEVWCPQLTQFEGRTFLFHCLANDSVWKFWVTLLGDENEANNFEIKMDARRDGSPLNISFRGKIYGAPG